MKRRLVFTLVGLTLAIALLATPTRRSHVRAEPSGCMQWRQDCLNAAADYQHACLLGGGGSSYCAGQYNWFLGACNAGLGDAGCLIL